MEWIIDPDIVFFIKTMKKKHLSDAVTKGEFCFSCPETFVNDDNGKLNGAQKDTWDSSQFYEAKNLYVYPIIKEDKDGIQYGPGIKLADKTTIREMSSSVRHTPFCCFRKVTKDELECRNKLFVFSLGDTVDRIKNEFGHDSFVLIADPNEFIHRLYQKEHNCYGRSIFYGELTSEYMREIEEHTTKGFQQIKMFQKRDKYAWQKEYRIILTPTKETTPRIVHIGSIEDITIGGDIENLRLGYAFGFSEDFEKKQMLKIGRNKQ